MKLNKLDI